MLLKQTLIVGMVAFMSVATAQPIYKCSDDGRVIYSQIPCAPGAAQVKTAPASGHADPVEAERSRQRHISVQSDLARKEAEAKFAKEKERRDAIAAAGKEVWRIREENYDPQKCAIARARVAEIKRRDPVSGMYGIDSMEFQQKASLYCGNRDALLRSNLPSK